MDRQYGTTPCGLPNPRPVHAITTPTEAGVIKTRRAPSTMPHRSPWSAFRRPRRTRLVLLSQRLGCEHTIRRREALTRVPLQVIPITLPGSAWTFAHPGTHDSSHPPSAGDLKPHAYPACFSVPSTHGRTHLLGPVRTLSPFRGLSVDVKPPTMSPQVTTPVDLAADLVVGGPRSLTLRHQYLPVLLKNYLCDRPRS